MRKDLNLLPGIYTVNPSPSPLHRACGPFQANWALRKGHNPTFWGPLDSGSELTLIPVAQDVSVVHHSEQGLMGILGTQWAFSSGPAHSGCIPVKRWKEERTQKTTVRTSQ